jgi:hypothetical protein
LFEAQEFMHFIKAHNLYFEINQKVGLMNPVILPDGAHFYIYTIKDQGIIYKIQKESKEIECKANICLEGSLGVVVHKNCVFM